VTIRRNTKRLGLDAVIAGLPARFREARVYADRGVMTGLQDYMTDLSDHLRHELDQKDPPTVEVMTILGIPPSEWYRALLTQR
jgi:hypothetical protein